MRGVSAVREHHSLDVASGFEQAVVLATAAGVTFGGTAAMRRVAPKLGLVNAPGERHVHERATPTGGGAAMLVGLLVALALASRLDGWRVTFASSSDALAVIVGAVVIFTIGALDDLRPISAPAKVAGQALAGVVIAVGGITLLYVRVPWAGLFVLSSDWALLVTVVLVVVVANAVNVIDGLDGLAAGTVAIGAAAVYLYAEQLKSAGAISEHNIGSLLALAAIGVCVGFLPHNYHPARIFMGDGGSMLLGLLMAAATVTVSGRVVDHPAEVAGVYFVVAPALVPALVLGVPLLDSAWAVLRRAMRGEPIANADKEHIHHRLMALGHGHRRAVWLLWAWTALLAAVALVPTYVSVEPALLSATLAAAVLTAAVVLLRLLMRRPRTEPAPP